MTQNPESLTVEQPGVIAPHHGRHKALLEFLKREVWPLVPVEARGRPMTRDEQDEILGFGPDGVSSPGRPS